MRDVLSKLRINMMIFNMRIKNLWFNITKPFKVAYEVIKHYNELRKIDLESKDGWERYLRKKELENKDKLELRRAEFFSLKAKIITAYFMTSLSEIVFIVSKEHPEEAIEESRIESSKAEFLKNKQELCSLIDELKGYDEISFDSEIDMKIRSWEFEDFETEAELTSWETKFSEYFSTLDII